MNNVYTHGHHESVVRSHSWRTAENSARYLLPHLRPGMSLLDVGAGPGTITADLARLVEPGRITALEANDDALDITRATFATLDVEVELVVGDVHALDIPDDTYDVVHAHQVLQHVADPVQALREMRRVCKPGGTVAVRDSDYHGFVWYPELPELDEWMALYQRMARANGGEPDAGRRLLSWALQAGFEKVEPSATNWCFATDEDRAWWGGMWADRILKSALADQARAAGVPDQTLTNISTAWKTWSTTPGAWISILHGELLCTA